MLLTCNSIRDISPRVVDYAIDARTLHLAADTGNNWHSHANLNGGLLRIDPIAVVGSQTAAFRFCLVLEVHGSRASTVALAAHTSASPL